MLELHITLTSLETILFLCFRKQDVGPSLIMVPLETFPFSPSLQFVSLFARVVNICNVDDVFSEFAGVLAFACVMTLLVHRRNPMFTLFFTLTLQATELLILQE